MKHKMGLWVIVFFVFCWSIGAANIPRQINYQGLLADLEGNTLNGNYNFSFDIFSVETGGTSLWNETQSDIIVTEGVFSVLLGSINPITADFSGRLWLQITVNNEPMFPRKELTGIGNAFQAEDVLDKDIHPRSIAIYAYGDVINSSGEWVGENTGLVGPTGPMGPTGSIGPAGPMGSTGPTGPMGPTGSIGPAGPMGSTGPMGPTGSIGPAGPMGSIGPTGPMGPTGSIGPAGPMGSTGPAGPAGPIGLPGVTGAQGIQGPTGPSGTSLWMDDTQAGHVTTSASVGIGVTVPQSTLHVNGSIQIGPDANDCTPEKAGALRFQDGELQLCDGYSWLPFVSAPPHIVSLEPAEGPAYGGTVITISGTNFKTGLTATLGGRALRDIQVQNPSQITAKTPAGFLGNQELVVTNPNGFSDTLLDAFLYDCCFVGVGSDGPLNVTAANTIVNTYGYVTDCTVSAGSSAITLDSVSGFSIGDEVLIHNSQHATNFGTYEFAVISGIQGNVLTLESPLLHTYYSCVPNAADAAVTQVVLVPQYTTVNLNSGASLTATAWNGYSGGITVFRASETVNLAGSIDVTRKGFRGGAAAGEGADNYSGFIRTGGGNGGDGGREYRSPQEPPGMTGLNGTGGAGGGGGGCGNGGTGLGGHGGTKGGGGGAGDKPTGDFLVSSNGQDACPTCDGVGGGPGAGSIDGSSAGGGGGAPRNSGTNPTPENCSTMSLGGGASSGAGGGGAGGQDDLTAGTHGRGGLANGTGGAGQYGANGSNGGNGQAGGGIVFITAQGITVTGSVAADGGIGGNGGSGATALGHTNENGGSGGGGGGADGAAGGVIVLEAKELTIGESLLHSNGGNGGTAGTGALRYYTAGAGGNGAAGSKGTDGRVKTTSYLP